MLVIEISSDGGWPLTLTELNKYNIPAPPNGFNSEINNAVVMKFEDEQEAIDYAHDLDEFAEALTERELSKYPDIRDIIAEIIKSISDDEFVQAYIQS